MTVHASTIVAADEALLLPTLLRILKLVRAFQDIRLAEIGLVHGQDEFLLALDESAPKSVRDIAELLGTRASTISKMADILQAKGFVERVRCEEDRRSTLIRPTPEGVGMRRVILDIWDGLDKEFFRMATSPDRNYLRREFETLQAHLARRLARLR